ncbi:PhnD/SsuA/transferrin family substrate-binding protein [Pseudoalteromonas fenneropenaei]|uniref:PhnD/SsuA/transferrin family substrate-binding protein n=1 Tax=Pseudoalteromonas fenneropenaei TaxID=1737459 RepID=A0ABV7CMR4_9GAMM
MMRTTSFPKSIVALSAVLVLVLCWMTGSLFIQYRGETLNQVDSNVFTCRTTLQNNQQRLVGYVPVAPMAKRLAAKFCENPVVAKQFGVVSVYYGSSISEQIEFMAKGVADVLLAKDNVVSAFKVQQTHNYQPLVSFKEYSAYLISLREKPLLSKAYLLDKRIGLLDYPTSRSGHILPMQQFKALDLTVESMKIVYANTHSELRQKLMAGEVDIISSYWQEQDKLHFSEHYITPIAQNIAGTKWYLRMNENNTELACALQQLLVEEADANSGYFNEPKTYWQCQQSPFFQLALEYQ